MRIKKIEPIKKPEYEPGAVVARIPKLEEVIDKLNEIIDLLNQPKSKPSGKSKK